MMNVETQETTETGGPPVPLVIDETTYVLIHGHSFSFGIGDLRLWLRHLGSEIDPTSIAGIYRLLQSDYRVDYLFEVRNSRDAELLLRAGERNARSAGARYMSQDRFERAVMGQHRFGLDVTPPPENSERVKPKLPSFKKTVTPGAPLGERRAPASYDPYPLTRGRANSPVRRPGRERNLTRRVSRSPSPRVRQHSRSPSPRPRQRFRRMSPSPPRYRDRRTSTDRRPEPYYRRRSSSPRYRRSPMRELSPRRENRRRYEPSPGRRNSQDDSRSREGEPALAQRLTDPDTIGRMAARTAWDARRQPSNVDSDVIGRMAARTAWDSRPRSLPTAPRAERRLADRLKVRNPGSVVATAPLLERLTDPKKPLLERLQTARDEGKRALMERMEVGLKERVSTLKSSSGHRRVHNRPKKRLERLLRWEEEIRQGWEEFRWSDAEIDWFIDQEELLPPYEDDEMDLD
ncbi:hypothetical protein B0H14DRAFT_3782639 [Mycena olivaceomarginata]|nr:hypothetical protein B0H14DRAFT_3782639 [Mycena olivaceomarginata]